MTKELRDAYLFQRRYGMSHQPQRAALALKHAKAWLLLQEAVDCGVAEIDWCEDEEIPADEACCEDCAHDISTGWVQSYRCAIWINGEPVTEITHLLLQSLGHDPAQRVVEAELAAEVHEELEAALDAHWT
jgi:hypothetical protein